MTPKEKAKELVSIIGKKIGKEFKNGCFKYNIEVAKQCALIAVDEVKWFHKKLFYLTDGSLFDKYLDDVKQEINKL